MNPKILYKAKLGEEEKGLIIFFEEWHVVRETPCFWMCADNINIRNKKLKRISKTSGRFAFESKEKALEHLRFLKRKQLAHMKRDTELLTAFLDGEYEPDPNIPERYLHVKNTGELVRRYFFFD